MTWIGFQNDRIDWGLGSFRPFHVILLWLRSFHLVDENDLIGVRTVLSVASNFISRFEMVRIGIISKMSD